MRDRVFEFEYCSLRHGPPGQAFKKMNNKASSRSGGGVRPRSPSHAAKNKTPEDRVCEFGWMLTEKEGRLMCKACSLYLDHTRRSTIVEHLRSRKHQRFLQESEADFCVLNFEPASVSPLISLEICEDESQNNTQSSCDRRSSQSSPAPVGMAGPYLLKKETHCATILDQLLRDDTFCDVTLTAEGQSMRAHKIVLCLASAYFRQVLSKEANVQNVIVFRDIKFAELKNLINFIYTGEATVDAAELESFMKTAEMLEVTSLCDGQRKIPKNLIPKSRDTESERTRVNVPSKRALNPSSTPPPSKSRKVDDSFKTAKSVAQASTSGGTTHPSSVIHHQTPQVYLHSPPVIKSEPANEDENPPEEDFRTFESLTQSPGYHQGSDATQSIDNDTGPPVHKAPVGGCPFCPSSDQILTGVTLTQHLSTTHPDKTVFPCHTCLRVFLKKGPYDAHIENCNR